MHDLFRDGHQSLFVPEGVGPQPDQGLGHADLELRRDHARGLMDDGPQVGVRNQLCRERTGGCVGLHEEHRLGGHISHDEGVGVLFCSERPRLIPVEVECTEPKAADSEREPEHGSHAGVDRWSREAEPPRCRRVEQGQARERARLVAQASTHGPSPSSNCSSSI